MILKNNAIEAVNNFVESEKVRRVYDALKVGVEKDNLVIIDTMLQNLLNQFFLLLPSVVEATDEDFNETGPKIDSVKKFLKGEDKRFSVGLDLLVLHVLKDKRLLFKFQALFINENANAIKFFDDKELEYAPTDEIIDVYNTLIDKTIQFLGNDSLAQLKL